MIDWNVIIRIHRFGCPDCGAELMTEKGVQYDGKKIWCRSCAWHQRWKTITDIRKGEA